MSSGKSPQNPDDITKFPISSGNTASNPDERKHSMGKVRPELYPQDVEGDEVADCSHET